MDILALSELLHPPSSSILDTRIKHDPSTSNKLTPASVCVNLPKSNKNEKAQKDHSEYNNDYAIWSEDEISKLPKTSSAIPLTNSVTFDRRKEPKYEIYFKQAVGTEDVFLGMSGKSPASFDCTHIVVKVYFPACKRTDLDLDVKENSLSVESDDFKLNLNLPRDVDPLSGNAQWDQKIHVLTVTLPIMDKMSMW